MNDAVTAGDVVFGYGAHVALARSSFSVPQAAITAIIGPNGSGKSTILNGIAGLLRPFSGSIRLAAVDGHPPHLAYVLQTTKVNDVLPVTVKEVVMMGRYSTKGAYRWIRDVDQEAVASAMARVGIGDLANHHLSELSGGQRQRVFIAQGLAQEHDILLLDEPLTGLDIGSARAIDTVIHDEQANGCTIVMTTHDLAEARVADHVVLLAGRVVASGQPDAVLTLEHLIAAYGPSLLHVEGERLFLDDPAHTPVPGRHVHLERTIHVETPPADPHGGAG